MTDQDFYFLYAPIAIAVIILGMIADYRIERGRRGKQ
jgi:hypothetical protein